MLCMPHHMLIVGGGNFLGLQNRQWAVVSLDLLLGQMPLPQLLLDKGQPAHWGLFLGLP